MRGDAAAGSSRREAGPRPVSQDQDARQEVEANCPARLHGVCVPDVTPEWARARGMTTPYERTRQCGGGGNEVRSMRPRHFNLSGVAVRRSVGLTP
jgi:hypothetical protein